MIRKIKHLFISFVAILTVFLISVPVPEETEDPIEEPKEEDDEQQKEEDEPGDTDEETGVTVLSTRKRGIRHFLSTNY